MGKRTSAVAATYPRAQKRMKREAEEAKVGKSLDTMPPLVLAKVAERLEHYDRIAFASTCTTFCDAIFEVVNKEREEGEGKRKVVTNLRNFKLVSKAPCFSLDWFKWVHGSFDRREGVAWRGGEDKQKLYDSDLMKLAAFQGSVETMKWLRSLDPPCPWDRHSCLSAASGGHLEVLKWLKREGCPWTSDI